jgi:hypothetical protein
MRIEKSKITDKDILRFFKKVEKLDANSCWNWLAGKWPRGYGHFSFCGKSVRANRFSYILHNKDIEPDSLYVCHTCDNPSCVNPGHLFLTDSPGNTKDKCEKGRQAKGIQNGNTVLTESQVLEIYSTYHSKTHFMGQKKLAKLYNVGKTTIKCIVQGITWAWLTKHIS